LENKAKIELRDYREIAAEGRELYDAIVSVGMAEHVGRDCRTTSRLRIGRSSRAAFFLTRRSVTISSRARASPKALGAHSSTNTFSPMAILRPYQSCCAQRSRQALKSGM